MSVWLKALILLMHFDHLTAVSREDSSPTRVTFETSQVLLVGIRRFFCRFL